MTNIGLVDDFIRIMTILKHGSTVDGGSKRTLMGFKLEERTQIDTLKLLKIIMGS